MDNVPNSGYQKWDGRPDSPVLTALFPYQAICTQNYAYGYLLVSEYPLYVNESSYLSLITDTPSKAYGYSGGAWVLSSENDIPGNTISVPNTTSIDQANNDIYTDIAHSAVYFEATTSGGMYDYKRVRSIRKKGESAFERTRALKHKSTAWERVNL